MKVISIILFLGVVVFLIVELKGFICDIKERKHAKRQQEDKEVNRKGETLDLTIHDERTEADRAVEELGNEHEL